MTRQPTDFWGHLEVLRSALLRCVAVVAVAAAALFALREQLFAVLFAPASSSFITYRILGAPPFHVRFINTELARQFTVHLEVALMAGVVVAAPYILYELSRFVSPALTRAERRLSGGVVLSAAALFALGVLLNYFIIFPFAFRFLATYQVTGAVVNQISLSSYVGTLLSLSLWMGLMCEMPVLAWFLGRMGLIDARLLARYRRHAIVALLVVAAVITPTADAFTLLLVAVPLYGLYELSIAVVRRSSAPQSGQ